MKALIFTGAAITAAVFLILGLLYTLGVAIELARYSWKKLKGDDAARLETRVLIAMVRGTDFVIWIFFICICLIAVLGVYGIIEEVLK